MTEEAIKIIMIGLGAIYLGPLAIAFIAVGIILALLAIKVFIAWAIRSWKLWKSLKSNEKK